MCRVEPVAKRKKIVVICMQSLQLGTRQSPLKVELEKTFIVLS